MSKISKELNLEDLDMMKHAIGFDYPQEAIKRHIGHVHRNYIVSNGPDAICEKLVKLECMKFQGINGLYGHDAHVYSVTFSGMRIIQQMMGLGRIKLEVDHWKMGTGYIEKLQTNKNLVTKEIPK